MKMVGSQSFPNLAVESSVRIILDIVLGTIVQHTNTVKKCQPIFIRDVYHTVWYHTKKKSIRSIVSGVAIVVKSDRIWSSVFVVVWRVTCLRQRVDLWASWWCHHICWRHYTVFIILDFLQYYYYFWELFGASQKYQIQLCAQILDQIWSKWHNLLLDLS